MSITPCAYNDCGWCYHDEAPFKGGCVGISNCKIYQEEEKDMKYKSTALRIARQKYGVSFNDIKEGMRLANTDDPDLGARYALANGLGVKVYGDRHKWNLRVAKSMLNGN